MLARSDMGSAPSANPIEHFARKLVELCIEQEDRSIKIPYDGTGELHLRFDIEDSDIREFYPHIYNKLNFHYCCDCNVLVPKACVIWHEERPFCDIHAAPYID